MWHYFSNDTTCAVLFKEMVSLSCGNLIKIIQAVSEKIAIWGRGEGYLKGPYFWS
jgi:hypothetical protein